MIATNSSIVVIGIPSCALSRLDTTPVETRHAITPSSLVCDSDGDMAIDLGLAFFWLT